MQLKYAVHQLISTLFSLPCKGLSDVIYDDGDSSRYTQVNKLHHEIWLANVPTFLALFLKKNLNLNHFLDIKKLVRFFFF
jgi:hypothetical protein